MQNKISDHLPEEVIIEILCRLPLKAVVKFTCVCKLWNNLIKSPEFISTHFQKSLISNKTQSRHLFLHRYRFTEIRGQGAFFLYKYSLRFDNKDLDEYMLLQPPVKHLQVLGSCNGLICLYSVDFQRLRYGHGCRFILWNPSIRKSILLPLPNYVIAAMAVDPTFDRSCHGFVGFGFDSRTQDYKVLRIMNNFRTELYSLTSNSWKDITDITPNYALKDHGHGVPAFLNDALHWIGNVYSDRNTSRVKNLVAVFDFRDEVFRQFQLPEPLDTEVDYNSRRLTVRVFEESTIAVVYRNENNRNYESDIWVMKEYGVESSWLKIGTAGKRDRGCSDVLELRNNGEVLIQFAYPVGIASQNTSTQRLKNLLLDCKSGWSSFYRYVESLALLNRGD